jgi:hypothetical protein
MLTFPDQVTVYDFATARALVVSNLSDLVVPPFSPAELGKCRRALLQLLESLVLSESCSGDRCFGAALHTEENERFNRLIGECWAMSGKWLPVEVIPAGDQREAVFRELLVDIRPDGGGDLNAFVS